MSPVSQKHRFDQKVLPLSQRASHLVVLVGLGLEVLPHPGGRVVAHHSHTLELFAAGFCGLVCQVGCGLTTRRCTWDSAKSGA